ILDHCYRHRHEPGIKAIILYPMNALAADQAKRLAAAIWHDERLQGQVTAGLYVGGKSETAHTIMGPEQIIDSRAALRDNPPDILLTNYKMLDFLLLRPEDKPLWAGNGPETLRYLVLDELHTYDGAQGSDVAGLIRRLQARLNIPPGHLCPVGTSATVVSESGDTQAALTRFAAQIFAADFPAAAVIGESRVSLAEFLSGESTLFDLPANIPALAERVGEAYDNYLQRQMRLWFGEAPDPIKLGETLRRHNFLRTLLSVTQDNVLPLADISAALSRRDPAFAALSPDDQRLVLQSFLAPAAYARTQDGDRAVPFLTLQAQLWVREMSRLMRQVSAEPAFFWRDDIPLHAEPRGLPAYVCRECGHSGWLTLRREGDEAISDDTGQIYRHYFDRHKNTLYVYPANRHIPGSDENRLIPDHLCPRCLQLSFADTCKNCDTVTIPVILHRETSRPRNGRPPRDLQRCPVCATDGSLGILGRQAAGLLSVAISHLFTSPLNTDNKLLAFTDSVQDASHRAAFFGARTYRFNLRTAFQAVLEDLTAKSAENAEGGLVGIPLNAFTDELLEYWLARWQAELPDGKQAQAGQKLAAAFMPPDLQQMPAYRQYMDGAAKPIPPDLKRSLRQRLSWEVTMEYGFNSRVGRSLEKA
ncbi:MAG: DEAD/DEAH box helicase, partial [Anaerolineae bacterium]